MCCGQDPCISKRDDKESEDQEVTYPLKHQAPQGLPMKGESQKLFNRPGHEKAG